MNINPTTLLSDLASGVVASDDPALHPDRPFLGGWSLLHLLNYRDDAGVRFPFTFVFLLSDVNFHGITL